MQFKICVFIAILSITGRPGDFQLEFIYSVLPTILPDPSKDRFNYGGCSEKYLPISSFKSLLEIFNYFYTISVETLGKTETKKMVKNLQEGQNENRYMLSMRLLVVKTIYFMDRKETCVNLKTIFF